MYSVNVDINKFSGTCTKERKCERNTEVLHTIHKIYKCIYFRNLIEFVEHYRRHSTGQAGLLQSSSSFSKSLQSNNGILTNYSYRRFVHDIYQSFILLSLLINAIVRNLKYFSLI